MGNRYFVEDSFSLTPNDVIQGRQHGHSDISYWLDDDNDPSVVSVSMGGKEPQMLNLEWEDITYGKRAYFQCSCGLRATKLYLPLNGREFKCRKCHKLQYQLTTFNRYSVAGKVLYKMNRLQKLSESRANMGRILYNGKYTQKFERFLGLCEKAGFDSIAKGANDLKALLKI